MWEVLANTMRGSAHWRRHMAKQHPEDADRNMRASASLDRLADEVEGINDPVLALRYAAACEEDLVIQLGEVEQEEIRAVGFRSEPKNGTCFVTDILDQLGR